MVIFVIDLHTIEMTISHFCDEHIFCAVDVRKTRRII